MAKNTNREQEKNEMQNMAEILKAMAHSDRLAILKLLCKNQVEGLTVKTIYEKLQLEQPVVSRHLNILKSAGVVRRLQEGQKTNYCLCTDKKNIESLLKCFC
ncbi:MAG: helix-turn-helix transcriptional regulator [Lacibacter sp.]|jgi:ArsR family transcriptional regulator